MKIYNKTLKKAYRYLRAGKNGKVVSLLEPKVPMFLENYQFYYILGVACLRNGDTGGADTYLKRAVQVDRNAVAPRLFPGRIGTQKKRYYRGSQNLAWNSGYRAFLCPGQAGT